MGLIERAYIIYDGGHLHVWPPKLSVEGGPAWINSASYRIEAKSEGSEGRGLLNGPMLQALLEDRFQLKIRRETRHVPVYALTVAKGGAKLRPYREGSCVPLDLDQPPPSPDPAQPDPVYCGMSEVTPKGYKLYHTTLTEFATEFSDRLDRPVIDKTGIAGTFNINLDLPDAELYPRESGSTDPYSTLDAVRAALRKVGLNLESTKGPGEFLVIDHVERPSEN